MSKSDISCFFCPESPAQVSAARYLIWGEERIQLQHSADTPGVGAGVWENTLLWDEEM